VTLLDVGVLLLAAAAAYRGFRRGLLGQALEFGGGLLGLLIGLSLGPRLASALINSPGLQGAAIALVTVLVGLSLGQVLGFALGQHFGSMARRARLGGVDSGLGAAFGLVVILIAYWLLGSLLARGSPLPQLTEALGRSRILAALNDVAEPPNVLAYVTHYLDTSKFPPVFVDPSQQRDGASIRLPSSRVGRAAFRAAGGSTVRVAVPACGGVQLGSGWIAGENTVVTNAHVVAGGDSFRIEDATGRHPATVVLFDPRTDLAVLRTGDLAGPPLRLETSLLAPGAAGATLGYPGEQGGNLDAQPAAVQRHLPARGLDIYGRSEVVRDVYELRARVRQGDSGGPFVLANGRVAGVIFAASTTDPGRTGYALTGMEVSDEIRDGTRATEAVDTGDCTH
jgi:S1-C subfamily serine protease